MSLGDTVIITAPWDSFKSTFALEMAYALSTASVFLDRFQVLCQPLTVGVVQCEIDPGSYDERLQEAELDRTDNLLVYSDPQYHLSLRDLSTAIHDSSLDVVVIDPMGVATREYVTPQGEQFNENWNQHVRPLIRQLRSLGATVIMVHHDPKPSQGVKNWASGASAWLNDPDTRIHLERSGPGEIKVEVKTRLQHPAKPFFAYMNGRRLHYRSAKEEDDDPRRLRK